MSGGAGYVLSKEALRRLVKNGLANRKTCRRGNDGNEDVEIGNTSYNNSEFNWSNIICIWKIGVCLHKVNVTAGDSRDSKDRERFFPLPPSNIIQGGEISWYPQILYYPSNCVK